MPGLPFVSRKVGEASQPCTVQNLRFFLSFGVKLRIHRIATLDELVLHASARV